jgi:hypothetical protein
MIEMLSLDQENSQRFFRFLVVRPVLFAYRLGFQAIATPKIGKNSKRPSDGIHAGTAGSTVTFRIACAVRLPLLAITSLMICT